MIGLNKNDKIEAVIETLGYKGEGIARLDRVPVFINGALPGEKVRALIILVKKDFAVGKLLEVLSQKKFARFTTAYYALYVYGICSSCMQAASMLFGQRMVGSMYRSASSTRPPNRMASLSASRMRPSRRMWPSFTMRP